MNLHDVSLVETELCWFIGVLRSFTRETSIKRYLQEGVDPNLTLQKKLQTAKPKCKEP